MRNVSLLVVPRFLFPLLSTVAVASMVVGVPAACRAAVIGVSEDFSGGAGSVASWASVGVTPTTIAHSTSAVDGVAAGDGIAGDGAFVFDAINGTPGDEAVAFNFSGTMDLGDFLVLDFSVFNGNSSFNRARYALFNATDGTELAGTDIFQTGNKPGSDITLSYTATAADVGDSLQFRITEDHNNVARDVFLDSFSLTVPEPSSYALLGFGTLVFAVRRWRHKRHGMDGRLQNHRPAHARS